MALSLVVSYVQSNDNTTIKFTDDTGVYDVGTNPGGWGAPNIVVTDIVEEADTTGAKVHLQLDVTYTNSSNTTTTFEEINLYDLALDHDPLFAGFATVADLEWEFTAADFIDAVTGVALGIATSELPDGFWTFHYEAVDANDETVHYDTAGITEGAFIDGIVRNAMYDALRDVPQIYEYKMSPNYLYNPDFEEILDTLEKYAIFRGMLANISDSTDEDVLDILYTLEQMIANDNE